MRLFYEKYKEIYKNYAIFQGARTNGTGILDMEKGLLEEIKQNSQDIVLLSIEYQKNSLDFSPVNIHNNNFWLLIKLMASPKNSVKLRIAALEKGFL